MLPIILLGNADAWAVTASVVVTAMTLFLIGFYKARVTIGKPSRSGLQLMLIELIAAFAGFISGSVITAYG